MPTELGLQSKLVRGIVVRVENEMHIIDKLIAVIIWIMVLCITIMSVRVAFEVIKNPELNNSAGCCCKESK